MKCLQPLEDTETAWEDTLEESVTATMWGVLSCSWRANILIKHTNLVIKVFRITRNYQTIVLRQVGAKQSPPNSRIGHTWYRVRPWLSLSVSVASIEYETKTKEVIKGQGIHSWDISCFRVSDYDMSADGFESNQYLHTVE